MKQIILVLSVVLCCASFATDSLAQCGLTVTQVATTPNSNTDGPCGSMACTHCITFEVENIGDCCFDSIAIIAPAGPPIVCFNISVTGIPNWTKSRATCDPSVAFAYAVNPAFDMCDGEKVTITVCASASATFQVVGFCNGITCGDTFTTP